MLKNFSQYAVALWVRNNVISKDDAPVCCYGLELLLSTVINFAIMICISFISGKPFIIIPYILAFIPLRIFAGGYHSKSHVNCIIFNTVLFIISVLLSFVSSHNAVTLCTFLNFISLLLIISFSPVEAKNKPLSEDEAKKYRKSSIYISALIFVISFILYKTNTVSHIAYSMVSYGEINAVFLMILGKFK